jgi:hypothetical protein
MTFPFPKNPADGEVVTKTASDGTILTATYRQSKNEWEMERVLPAPSTLALTNVLPRLLQGFPGRPPDPPVTRAKP